MGCDIRHNQMMTTYRGILGCTSLELLGRKRGAPDAWKGEEGEGIRLMLMMCGVFRRLGRDWVRLAATTHVYSGLLGQCSAGGGKGGADAHDAHCLVWCDLERVQLMLMMRMMRIARAGGVRQRCG